MIILGSANSPLTERFSDYHILRLPRTMPFIIYACNPTAT